MDITMLLLIIFGIGVAIALGVFSWRFGNVSDTVEEELSRNPEENPKNN